VPQSPRQGNGEGRLLVFSKGLGDRVNAKWNLLLKCVRSLRICKAGWGVQLNRKLPMVKIELLMLLRFFLRKKMVILPVR